MNRIRNEKVRDWIRKERESKNEKSSDDRVHVKTQGRLQRDNLEERQEIWLIFLYIMR